MRWIWGAALLALLLLVSLALRPAHAARSLACPPGARHNIEGVGPPSTPLLLLFDGAAIGGGVSGSNGAYRIPLVVGPERPGTYLVDVVRRDNRAVVDSLTCIVPAPNAASPAPAAREGQPTTAAQPTAAAAPTSASSAATPGQPTSAATAGGAASPTTTRTPTLLPSASATLRPGEPSPTNAPTSTPTTAGGGTAATATPTLSPTAQGGNLDFTLDDLDPTYIAGGDLDVTGSLLDANGDGIANITITARYTVNGVDAASPRCSVPTDTDGYWECPTVKVPSDWVGKTVKVFVTATVGGQSYTATGDSQFTVKNP